MHPILTLLELKDQIGEEENYSQMQPKVKMFESEGLYIKVLIVNIPKYCK